MAEIQIEMAAKQEYLGRLIQRLLGAAILILIRKGTEAGTWPSDMTSVRLFTSHTSGVELDSADSSFWLILTLGGIANGSSSYALVCHLPHGRPQLQPG